MKRNKLLFLLPFLWFSLFFLVFADINVWEDIEKDRVVKEIKGNSESLKLKRVKNNVEIEKLLIQKVLENFDEICSNFYRPVPLMNQGMILKGNTNIDSISLERSESYQFNYEGSKSKIEYSKTNIQKTGVDEPDILKNLGKYVVYYNRKANKVYIIENNLKDISQSRIVETINVPSVIRNVKILNTSNRLILMWTRSSKWGLVKPRTDILIFDISNLPKIKFIAFYDIKWVFFDSRLIDGKLYVISSYDFNQILYSICNKRWYQPMKWIKGFWQIFNVNLNDKQIKEFLKNNLKKYKNKIKKDLSDVINNKTIYLFYSKNGNLVLKWKKYPFKLWTKFIKSNNIYYIPADFSKIDSLNFNVVGIFDVQEPKDNFNQYFVWWNLRQWQIHMTKRSLYLVNNYYRYQNWRCPPGLYCIMPVFRRWDFTLIHKLRLDWFNLDYINTAVIPGKPINQYSMDEDSSGYFRIFTKYYYPQRATDLYVFDSWLTLVWELTNIAPGEEFKSSRFMGDKAFLVTFKATDPLFVIDLKDPTEPEIIWELKIPGYSLYLHPLYKFDDVRYLLGIWQEAKEVYWNWSLPRNVKIDVYEVDFWNSIFEKEWKEVDFQEKKLPLATSFKNKSYIYSGGVLKIYVNKNCCNTYINVLTDWSWDYKVQIVYTGVICKCFVPVMLEVKTNFVKNVDFEEIDLTKQSIEESYKKVKVTQLYSYVLWKEKEYKNGWSYTPVFDNPRTFVIKYDSNVKDKATVYLPVYLAKDIKEQRCYPIYRWVNGERKLLKEECYEVVRKKPYFIWVKVLQIYKDEWIKEIFSKNFINKIWEISQWEYKNQGHRVGYVNQYIFEVNNLFYDIFDKVKEKFIFLK